MGTNKIKKILIIFGTRPEAIKLAPVIIEASRRDDIECLVCNTAQHRELTDEVLDFFDIQSDYDLDIMMPGQDLFDITARGIKKIQIILEESKPDLILVQGDTTSAYLGALAGYYKKIKVGHIEAGLRSGNIYAPHPEEVNRKMIGGIADYHFAPTQAAVNNLKNENVQGDILLTGNTVIDALSYARKKVEKMTSSILPFSIDENKRTILLTTHRRENFGQPLLNIIKVVKAILLDYSDVEFIIPVHPNPNVKELLYSELNECSKVKLVDPLSYPKLIYLMSKCHLILSDSGGIQEEAPTMGVPIVVLRDITERKEGIMAGTALLGTTDFVTLLGKCKMLLDDPKLYNKMAKTNNPYGDGTAAFQILNHICV